MSIQYATKAAFDVYIDYLALKKHFTSKNYDYHKYNGKVRASFDKFQTRNDVFFFYKLSKQKHSRDLMLANLLKDPNIWIRDLCEEAAKEVYLEWKKRQDSISYIFKSELSKLDENYFENFKVSNGQHPKLITLFLQKKISLETILILTRQANAIAYWESEISDKHIAKDVLDKLKKYEGFLELDYKKFNKIVKDYFL